MITYDLEQDAAGAGLREKGRIRICMQNRGPDLYIGDLLRKDGPFRPASDWHQAKQNDPAILIYTGGTTGRPKGVIHTHHSIGSFCGAKLSSFKLPTKLLVVESLPRTLVNRIDKKRLRNSFE